MEQTKVGQIERNKALKQLEIENSADIPSCQEVILVAPRSTDDYRPPPNRLFRNCVNNTLVYL